MAGPVTLTGAYDLIIQYQNASDSSVKWRNTYTFLSDTVPLATTGIPFVIAAYAVALVHSDVNLISWTCYNWSRGRQPYPDGSPVFTHTASLPGTAGTAFSVLATPYTPYAGEACLRIDHEPASGGKPGRTFCRGLLGEGDLSAISGGKLILGPSVASLQAELDALIIASGLDAYFGAGSGGQSLAIVRWSAKPGAPPPHAVGVTSFAVIGATTNKLSRKNRR